MENLHPKEVAEVLRSVLKTVSNNTYSSEIKQKIKLIKDFNSLNKTCSNCNKKLKFIDLENIRFWKDLNKNIAECKHCKTSILF